MLVGYLAAVVMGLTLGLIGAGGSILTVPILVYLFEIEPVLATTYSLFIVGSTAMIGALGYLRQGQIRVKTAFLFAIPSIVGVFLVRWWGLPLIPAQIARIGGVAVTKNMLIMAAFAVVMLLASRSMIMDRKPVASASTESETKLALRIASRGFLVGGLTGFVGAGGGFLVIPVLVVLLGLPMKEAIGTSLMIITINALSGFLSSLDGALLVDWGLLSSVTAVAAVGILSGFSLARHVPGAKLKPFFGWFILLMGSWILYRQF